MSRFPSSSVRRTAVAGLALATATGLAAVLPALAHSDSSGQHARGRTLVFQSPLSDLQPNTTQPLEGGAATLRMTLGRTSSSFVLQVSGIDRSARGMTYGAHLHSGPCVPGDGAAAGPHYNSATPPVVDEDHEVWLDFTVSRRGTGRAVAHVPFVPVHGARSVVIHEMATDHDTGGAGARLACIPVVW
jgi:superoxide dismutase, Cu-Zn family